jgi:AbiV family abortive infection protein
MKDEKLVRFNSFRKLCLSNSQDALKTAELLQHNGVNHIVFHLAVLSLEEIGKIFLGWYQITVDDSPNQDGPNMSIDDHEKKLFWAIWGPTFLSEKISNKQMAGIRGLASQLHAKRLDSLYTDLTDTDKSAKKISDDDVNDILKYVKSALELAEVEGEVNEELQANEDMKWFMKASNNPAKRNFIFGDISQEKRIEFGNVVMWIDWLKNHFVQKEKSLNDILLQEMKKGRPEHKALIKPKWKMKFKIMSQSHSIRQNVFKSFNERYGFVALSKGSDNHTLNIEVTFDNNILVGDLWNHGIIFGKLFVAALNVASNGVFYWNIVGDTDKYYDSVWDIENRKHLLVKLPNGFRVKWEDGRLVLTEQHLHLTMIVFEYFSFVYGKKEFESVKDYIDALGMMAKTDIHLRLEKVSFKKFYNSFVSALKLNEKLDEGNDTKDVGYQQIEKMLNIRTEFDRIMNIGEKLFQRDEQFHGDITLTETIGMKQYSGLYLMTLAVRKLKNNKTLRLTNDENDKSDA